MNDLTRRQLISQGIVLFATFQAVFCLTYNYGDGSYYVGEVDDYGLPKGTGKFFNTSGNLEYHGEFYDGVPHGNGTWYGGDGSVYVGSFRYGRSSGYAVMTYPSGDTATGEFLDMKPHGRVLFEATDIADSPDEAGDDATDGKVVVMRGQFRHGMAHGNIFILYRVPLEVLLTEEPTEDEGQVTIAMEGTFRMGLPHGIIKIRQSAAKSHGVEKNPGESESKEGPVIAEAKFLYGRPLLDGQRKDWRSSAVLQKALQILKQKLVI